MRRNAICTLCIVLGLLCSVWVYVGANEFTLINSIASEHAKDYSTVDGGAGQSLRDALAACESEFHWEGNATEMSAASESIKQELEDHMTNWHLRSYDSWAATYGGGKAIIDITGIEYWCSAEQRKAAEQDISDIVEKANQKPDAKSKALAIHNWLAKRVEYSKNLTSKGSLMKKQTKAYHMAHNAAGALVAGWYHGKNGGYGVCTSYAEAFNVIASRCNLKTRSAHSKTHRWTQVLSDNGSWYNVDVTFDDSCHGKILKKWFWITDERLAKLDEATKSTSHQLI